MNLTFKREIFSRIIHIGNVTLLHPSIVVTRIVEHSLKGLTDEEIIAILQGGDSDE